MSHLQGPNIRKSPSWYGGTRYSPALLSIRCQGLQSWVADKSWASNKNRVMLCSCRQPLEQEWRQVCSCLTSKGAVSHPSSLCVHTCCQTGVDCRLSALQTDMRISTSPVSSINGKQFIFFNRLIPLQSSKTYVQSSSS